MTDEELMAAVVSLLTADDRFLHVEPARPVELPDGRTALYTRIAYVDQDGRTNFLNLRGPFRGSIR